MSFEGLVGCRVVQIILTRSDFVVTQPLMQWLAFAVGKHRRKPVLLYSGRYLGCVFKDLRLAVLTIVLLGFKHSKATKATPERFNNFLEIGL